MSWLDRWRRRPPEPTLADLRAEVVANQAALTGQLETVLAEVGRLGREQFQVATRLEAHGEVLNDLADLADLWRDTGAAASAPPAAEVADSIRLGLVQEILPIADALAESIRAAERRAAGPAGPSETAGGLTESGRWIEPLAGSAEPSAGDPFAAWVRGLHLVEERLLGLLDRSGVWPIPAVGQPFDPHRHRAVAVEWTDRWPAGTIVAEELRGYRTADRILRHAEVVVARPTIPADERPADEEEAGVND